MAFKSYKDVVKRFKKYQPNVSTYQQLRPFIQEASQEKEKKSQRVQPLNMIFDLLQRGQYFTANIAEEITRSIRTGESLGKGAIDALQGAWKGLTGERKGNWEKILYGGDIEGGEKFEGWVPEEANIPQWAKSVSGFALNVLLDPTTYYGGPVKWLTRGFKGPTQAATQVAKRYADDAVKVFMKTSGDDTIKALAGVDITAKNLIKKYGKKHGDDISRKLNSVYKEAFNEGLMKSGKELQEASMERLIGGAAGAPEGIENLVKGIEKGYKGAGERAFKFMGKDYGKKFGASTAEKQWAKLGDTFKKTAPGQKFEDAWWAINNRGPLGYIKKLLGVRNPYEKAQNFKKMDINHSFDKSAYDEVAAGNQILKTLDEDLFDTALEVRNKAFSLGKNGIKTNVRELMRSPGQYGLEIDPKAATKISKFWDDLDPLLNKWIDEENVWASQGKIPEVNRIDNYFHTHLKGEKGARGAGGLGEEVPGITKKKSKTTAQHVQQKANMMRYLYGDKIEEAAKAGNTTVEDLVKKYGLADASVDLREMIYYRGIAHAKIKKRSAMIDAFKEFGIASNQLSEIPGAAQNIAEIGLKGVEDSSLQGYLFDPAVRDIIDKTLTVTGDEAGMQWLKNQFANFTSWWKGMVTMTTGFHFRNFTSNNITGLLKHGPQWFEPQRQFDAMVGTLYALHPEKYADMLKDELKVTDGWISRNLNKKIGNFKVKELADEARERGVISGTTHGFDALDDLKQLTKKGKKKRDWNLNPASRKFVGLKASRSVGNVLENQAKFNSFLIDYTNMAGKNWTAELGEDVASRIATDDDFLQGAAMESKKWFIDYGDLSDFEQKVMKNVIPFYSWIRHNLANQISGITLYPDMYSIIPKAQGAITRDEGFDYRIQPEWFTQQNMFPVGKDPETGAFIMRRPDTPVKDLNMIPIFWEPGEMRPTVDGDELIADVMQSAHPLIKTVMETAAGHNFFKRRAIKEKEEAPALMQYFTKHPEPLAFMDGILQLAGLNGVGAEEKKGKLYMDGRIERILSNNIPVLRMVEMLIDPLGEGLNLLTAGESEKLIEEVTGKKDRYEGLEEAFQLLSQWLGFKLKVMDPEYYESLYTSDILSEAEKKRREERSRMPGYEERRQKYLTQREIKKRRLGL